MSFYNFFNFKDVQAAVASLTPADDLSSVVSSCVCDLDVNLEASNDGLGTTWRNMVSSPADGASQTDYDFTNSGWALSGTVGVDALWLNSGNDSFTQSSSISSTPAFAKAHRSDQVNGFWMSYAFTHTNLIGADNWIGISQLISEIGFRVRLTSSETMQFLQNDGSSNNLSSNLTSVLVNNNDYLFVVTWDGSNIQAWLNGVKVSASYAFNTSEVDATLPMVIGQSMDNGHKAYHFGFGQEYLNDTQAAAIRTKINERQPIVF